MSFDHYFGTYPYAANTDGNPFHAKPRHPDGEWPVHQDHPERPGRPAAHRQPERYNPDAAHASSQALTCDQDHDYTPEQEAVNGGKMDKFVQNTESRRRPATPATDPVLHSPAW